MKFDAPELYLARMRRAKQLCGLALAGLLLVVSSVQVAAAPARYTSATTSFAIGEQLITVSVTLDAHSARLVRGPVAIVVNVPTGVQRQLASADRGFNRRGYAISFEEDTSLEDTALFLVTVPSRVRGYPLMVDIGASGGYAVGAPGNTNQAIALAITITP
ncbi:MAG: hypothetical protein M3R06_01890 [Chloroflexota bacterium]|nr:hypothetical protein [Chloroflexota bacterium]